MKVGVVIITHYRLGHEFLQALRLIVPAAQGFEAVSVEPSQGADEMRRAIADALANNIHDTHDTTNTHNIHTDDDAPR